MAAWQRGPHRRCPPDCHASWCHHHANSSRRAFFVSPFLALAHWQHLMMSQSWPYIPVSLAKHLAQLTISCSHDPSAHLSTPTWPKSAMDTKLINQAGWHVCLWPLFALPVSMTHSLDFSCFWGNVVNELLQDPPYPHLAISHVTDMGLGRGFRVTSTSTHRSQNHAGTRTLWGCSLTVTPAYWLLLFDQKPTTLLLSAVPPLRASAIRMSTTFFWTWLSSATLLSYWVGSSVMKPSHELPKHALIDIKIT